MIERRMRRMLLAWALVGLLAAAAGWVVGPWLQRAAEPPFGDAP